MFLTLLKEDIRIILKKDPAAQTWWEVLTCYPGLHALCFHRLAHALWLNQFRWAASLTAHFSRWITGIEIHPGAVIGRRVFIDHGMGIVIGETAVVGDDCTIYQGVTLGGTSLTRGTKRHPTLESGVIVGAGAKVLGSFTVGTGAKIGSNAVVVKPVPAGATVVGNPAHVVGRYDDAAKQEFSAYGVGTNDEDPIVQVLHHLVTLLERSQVSQKRLREHLLARGIDCGQMDDDIEIEHLKQLLSR